MGQDLKKGSYGRKIKDIKILITNEIKILITNERPSFSEYFLKN